MSQTPQPAPIKFTFRDILRSLNQKPMLLALLMGFSSGFPLLLSSKTFQAWVVFTGGSYTKVGLIALVGLPYSLKFLWAPFMDRYSIGRLGRRRGWMVISQLGVAASVFAMSQLQPASQFFVASICAICISFFGAMQDIVIDAYRRETLKENELGLGSSLSSAGYRAATWVTGGLALVLAQHISWKVVYGLLALVMLFNIGVTLWAEEPKTGFAAPKTLRDAVVLPLKEFFSRHGAVLMLVFILLYKVGDAMAGNMLTAFYQHLGFTLEEIGVIAKTMGPFALVIGTFLGGILILRFGIYPALFIFGVLQAASTMSFVILDGAGHSLPVFSAVVFFEDFTAGMGSAAFMAYMASLTNRNFTATQFALLTSLMALPRNSIAAATGPMVDFFGWTGFFIFCAIVAIPGLILIRVVYNFQKKNPPLPGAENPPEAARG